jgi:Male sterility protein
LATQDKHLEFAERKGCSCARSRNGMHVLQTKMPADFCLSGYFCDCTPAVSHLKQAESLAALLAFPNPYCLSKWLAERLVAQRCASGLPAVLVRPAIIGAVAAAPYPG